MCDVCGVCVYICVCTMYVLHVWLAMCVCVVCICGMCVCVLREICGGGAKVPAVCCCPWSCHQNQEL